MSELQIFRWRESLKSSQDLFKVKASDINILKSPFDFACANLVLLLPVKSEVVTSVSQSSNCEESFPFDMEISCSNELSRGVSFEHYIKVFVYLFRTSPMGSTGMGRWSVMAN